MQNVATKMAAVHLTVLPEIGIFAECPEDLAQFM
jgi:hypothetical protein